MGLSDNIYQSRLAATRATRGSWIRFSDRRTKTLPFGSNPDVEANRLSHTQTAPAGQALPPLPGSADGRVTTPATPPETSSSSAELHGPAGASAVRQRTTTSGEQSQPTTTDSTDDSKTPPAKKDRTFFKHLTPKTPFTVGNQIRRTLLNSWINVLLLAVPAGIAVNYVPSVSRVVVFVINFIAIVPLAAMLGFATEEIALRTGETIGGLLNATFG
jgi:Ca2+:H+ antiporter